MAQKQRIPAYAANGVRLRDFSLEAVWALLVYGRVEATTNRRGEIRRIDFLPIVVEADVDDTSYRGQTYSRQVDVDAGRSARSRVWEFRPLIPPQAQYDLYRDADSIEDVERFIRSIFVAVPLSIAVSPFDGKPEMTPPAQRKAKVIPFPVVRSYRTTEKKAA